MSRRRVIAWVLGLVACAAKPAAPGTPAPGASTAPERVAPRPTVDASTIDDGQIDADVATITGGNYAVDHLGPEVFAAIEARVAAAPARYARGVMRRVQSLDGDSRLADLWIAPLLGRLYGAAPDEVSAAAELTLTRLGWIAGGAIEEPRKQRIADQRPLLESLAGGIDRPWSEAWKKVVPDRLCAAPTPAGHGLRVELSCTCGEVPVCRTELDGDRVHVRVRVDATQPKRCFDCYPGRSTCTLPKLAPGQHVRVDIDGQAHGELIATPSGWLPPDVCLSKG